MISTRRLRRIVAVLCRCRNRVVMIPCRQNAAVVSSVSTAAEQLLYQLSLHHDCHSYQTVSAASDLNTLIIDSKLSEFRPVHGRFKLACVGCVKRCGRLLPRYCVITLLDAPPRCRSSAD